MAVDFETLGLRQVFRVHGVEMKFRSPVNSGAVTVTALDKTRGIEVQIDKSSFPTTKPAAMLMAKSLSDLHIDPSAMRGVWVEMNGKRWKVELARPVPGPQGEGKGQVMLVLSER